MCIIAVVLTTADATVFGPLSCNNHEVERLHTVEHTRHLVYLESAVMSQLYSQIVHHHRTIAAIYNTSSWRNLHSPANCDITLLWAEVTILYKLVLRI